MKSVQSRQCLASRQADARAANWGFEVRSAKVRMSGATHIVFWDRQIAGAADDDPARAAWYFAAVVEYSASGPVTSTVAVWLVRGVV